jgi:purine-nucleoside phosphorylase
LGSGLNGFSNELSSKNLIYEDSSGVHYKRIYLGKLSGKEIIVFEGRNHFFENPGNKRIFFNVNMAIEYGLKFLIITNAAGGINNNFKVSDLMLISSHINMMRKRFVPKFQTEYYDRNINNFIVKLAKENNIKLNKGIYCASPGPMYETKAEIKFMNKIGVDAVGMSTVPEIVTLNKFNIKTIAISCITNILSADNLKRTDHDEVLLAGKKAYPSFSKLVKLIINSYPF